MCTRGVMITRRRRDEDQPTGREQQPEHASAWPTRARLSGDAQRCGVYRAVGLSCLTLIFGRFSRDYRALRFKNTINPTARVGPGRRGRRVGELVVQRGVGEVGPLRDC